MKKIETTAITGALKSPFIKATHDHIKESIMDGDSNIVKGLLGSYTTNDLIILYGCVVTATIPGTSSITAGAIYYNGEIYDVDANAALLTDVGETLVWGVVTTYRSGDPVAWSDGTERNQHRIDKLALSAGASGSGLADYNGATVKMYDTGWIPMTVINNWASVLAPSYRRIGKTVYLRGNIIASGDETSATATILPIGNRPTQSRILTALVAGQTSPSFNGAGNIVIDTDGTIDAGDITSGFVAGTSTGTIYLEGISFVI